MTSYNPAKRMLWRSAKRCMVAGYESWGSFRMRAELVGSHTTSKKNKTTMMTLLIFSLHCHKMMAELLGTKRQYVACQSFVPD